MMKTTRSAVCSALRNSASIAKAHAEDLLLSDARLRAEVKELRKFVKSMALDPDENMHPDVYDHALVTQGLARDCLKAAKRKR